MQKQKMAFLFLYAFLAVGMMFNIPAILADEGSNSGSDSISAAATTDNSGSSDTKTATSEDLRKLEEKRFEERQKFEEKAMERLKRLNERMVKIEEETLKKQFREEGRNVNVTREVSIDADGTKTITITKTKTDENGNVKTKVIQYIIGANGEKIIKVKSECETEDGVEKCDVENENENEFHSDLNVSTEFENDSHLEATTSDGEKHKLKVLPDEARRIIMEKLKALNITNITLEEVKHKNIPGVVYQMETNKHGRFLGVFKLAMKVDSQVDPTTGEVLNVNKPWWAIFVVEQNENVPAATNETATATTAETTNAST